MKDRRGHRAFTGRRRASAMAAAAIALAFTATTTAASAGTPALSLTPAAGEVGASISATGGGFTEGDVELFVDAVDPARVLARTTVDRTGAFTVAFTIPSMHAGDHAVIACVARDPRTGACREQASAILTVRPAPTTTTTSTTATSTTATTRPTERPPATTTTTSRGSVAVSTTATTTRGPGGVAVATTATTTSTPGVVAVSTTLGGDPPGPYDPGPDGVQAGTVTSFLPEGTPTDIPNISIVAVEVTQGLQNLANDFPVLAQRPTWVRIHATSDAEAEGGQASVYAAVQGIRDGQELGIEWAINNPVHLANDIQRLDHDYTPYLQLPPDWIDTPGELTLRAWVFAGDSYEATNEPDNDDNLLEVTVDLQESRTIHVHYFPMFMTEDFDPDGLPVVHFADEGYLQEHLAMYRIWPVAKLVPHTFSSYIGDESSDWDLSEQDSYHGEPNLALAEMFELNDLGDDHIYMGMVSLELDSWFNGFTAAGTTWAQMGSGFGSPSWNHPSGLFIAHESAHRAGVDHAPCLYGENSVVPLEVPGGDIDLSFPASYAWPNCSLAPTEWDGYFGFDPLPGLSGSAEPAVMSNDNQAPFSARAFPFMGYKQPGWTDPWHGCLVLEYVDVECEQEDVVPLDADAPNGGHFPSPAAGGLPAFNCQDVVSDIDFCTLHPNPSGNPTEAPDADADLLISGFVDPTTGAAEVTRALTVPERSEPDGRLTGAPAAGGPYVLALVDDDGTAIWATTLDVALDSGYGGSGGSGPVWFLERFPALADTSRIVVASPAGVLAERGPSSSAPTVAVRSVDVDAGSMHISFEAGDADGDTVWTSVQYASGPGDPWVPVSAATRGATVTVTDLRHLASATDGRLRLLSTDGFLTTTALVDGVVVPDQPPVLTVTSPTSGTQLPAGRALLLEAHATDADDGGEPEVVWTSDRDGEVGRGPSVTTRELSEGRHVLTARVTDAAGQATETAVEIDITATDLPDAETIAAVGAVLDGNPEETGGGAAWVIAVGLVGAIGAAGAVGAAARRKTRRAVSP